MTTFKKGDRVRYVDRSSAFNEPQRIGDTGTVERDFFGDPGGCVAVDWDAGSKGMGNVFPENIKLIPTQAPRQMWLVVRVADNHPHLSHMTAFRFSEAKAVELARETARKNPGWEVAVFKAVSISSMPAPEVTTVNLA